MKFLVKYQSFKKTINQASLFSSDRSILPFAEDVFFCKKNEEQLSVCCTNLASAVDITLDVQGLVSEETETFSLDVKTLKKILPSIKPGDTGNVLVYTKKNNQYGAEVVILGESGNVSMRLSNKENTDSMRDCLKHYLDDWWSDLESFKTEGLFQELKKVMFCSSTYEERPVLQCVSMNSAMAATDGFRIVKNPVSYSGLDCMIESDQLAKAAKVFRNEVKTKRKANAVLFSDDHAIVFLTTTDGNFPDYNAIIPKTWWMRCEVDRMKLIEALNLSLISHKVFCGNNVAKFNFEDNLVKVFSEIEGEGSCCCSLHSSPVVASKEEHPNSKMELPFMIAVNARLMKEIVEHVSGERVVLKCHANNTPMVIESADEVDHPVYVLMPMHLG